MSKKYGNDAYWCFLEDGWETTRPLEIWHAIGLGHEEVMAHGTDKYNAMMIIDALIFHHNSNKETNIDNALTKREKVFLQFVSSNCPEPWSTMASNAITWEDREVFDKIKSKFSEIY